MGAQTLQDATAGRDTVVLRGVERAADGVIRRHRRPGSVGMEQKQ